MTSLKFGLQNETIFSTNSAPINAFYPIRNNVFFATTRSGLYRFEGTNIAKIYPYKLSTSMVIKEYEFFVGISSVGGEIFVMMLEDMENPLVSRFKTDQVAIFHLAYSPKSHVLVTVGSGIYIWDFKVVMPYRRTMMHRPTVEITFRAKLFPDYDTSILNPLSLDYDQELLYFPTKHGFCGFDFDGNEKKAFSRVEVNAQTASAVCNENKKFITARHSDGFHLWGKNGFLIKKIPGGVSSILAIRFINKHFAIFMDSNLYVSIIDIKTSKIFHCTTFSTKPTYFNVITYNNKYFLIVSQGWSVKMMEIVLPWTVWKNMTTQTYSIRRCPKYKDAARILAFYQSTVFSFLSPKDGKNLTSAVDTQPSAAIYHLYERGLFIENTFDTTNSFIESTNVFEIDPNNKRDVLFVTTEAANTSIFSTGNNPCQLLKIIEIQMSTIIVCELDGKFMYCSSSSQGELMFHNYLDFAPIKRILIKKDPIKKIFYHRKSSSIIVVFKDEFRRFDLKQFKDVLTIPIKDGGYSEFFGNLLFFGCKNGTIEAFRIEPTFNSWKFTQITDNCIHYHDDVITSFAFSPNFFISSSTDCTLKIWNYHFGLICDIIFPFPLFTCEILNGTRDILIGTDNEILIVKGKSIFGDEVDPEIAELDNYDKISDELTSQLIQFVVSQNEGDEMSDFLGDRLKKKDNENENEEQLPTTQIEAFHEKKPIVNEVKEKKVVNDKNEMSEEERNRRIAEMNLINEKSDKELRQQNILEEMRKKEKIRIEEEMKKKQEDELKRKQEEEENQKKEEEKRKKLEEKKKKEEEAKEKRRRKREEMRAEKRRQQEQQNQQVQFVDLDELMPVFKEIKEISDEEKEKNKNQFARQRHEYKPKQPSIKRPARPSRPNVSISKNESNGDNDDESENENSSENENEHKEEEEEVLILRKPTSSNTNVRTLGKKDQHKSKSSNKEDSQITSENQSNSEQENNDQLNSEQNINDQLNNEQKMNDQMNSEQKINDSLNSEQKINDQLNTEQENRTSTEKIIDKTNKKNNFVTSEISTQTDNIENEDNDNESEITKDNDQDDIILIEKSKRKQAESDDSIKLHSPKKKFSATQQTSKIRDNKKEDKGKPKKIQKPKRERSPLFDSKPRNKPEQIFLTQQIKRSPTPPPLRPVNNGNEKLSTKKYKVMPPRVFIRRSRTPPVLRQKKLVVLPGPEIKLDKEMVISRILSGHIELIPLLSRFPCEDRKQVILELKARNLVDDDFQPTSILNSYFESSFTAFTYQKRKEVKATNPNVSLHQIEIEKQVEIPSSFVLRPKVSTSFSMAPNDINKMEPIKNVTISIDQLNNKPIQNDVINDQIINKKELILSKPVRNSSPSAISPQLIQFPDPNARSNFSKDTKRTIRYRNGIVSKIETLTYMNEDIKRPRALLNNINEKPEPIPLIKLPKSDKNAGPYSARYNQTKRTIRLISADLDFAAPDMNNNNQLQSQMSIRKDKLHKMELVTGSQVNLNGNNRSRNPRQRLILGRSFSPPVLYKPKLLERYKQLYQVQRNNNNS